MKTNKTILLIVLLCVPAMVQGQSYRPVHEVFSLTNGLQVVLHPDSTLPLISVNLAYRAGSSRDTKGKTGIANIAGELLLTGTQAVPREELLRLRDMAGVSIQARTSVDWLNIASVFPASMMKKALTIEADRMRNATETVNIEYFDAIIAALAREHERRKKQSLGSFRQQIYHELYAEGHPYRHSTIGEADDLDSIRIEDVQSFMKRFYSPSNASLTVSGQFDAADVKRMIKEAFGDIPAGIASRWKDIPDAFTPIGQSAFIREDRLEYNVLHMVFPSVRYGHEDEAALQVLAKILNGSAHSLIQQGMVSVNPSIVRTEAYQSSQELGGNFWISITVKPEAKLTPLYRQIMQLLESLAADGATEEEIIGARNQIGMDFFSPQEAFYGFGGRGDLLNLGMMYSGNPLLPYLLYDKQQSVISADIQRVAGKYLTDGNQLLFSAVPMGKREYAVEP